MLINEFVNQCHEIAKSKGFWDKPREVGTMIALVHSEVTEALGAMSCAEFCEELADICIRIGDMCGGLKVDLAFAINDVIDWLKTEEPENWQDVKTPTTLKEIDDMFKGAEIFLDSNDQAVTVHKNLSYALESDRKKENDAFRRYIARVFLLTFTWAAEQGYYLTDSILAKMGVNKERPHLHGKEY